MAPKTNNDLWIDPEFEGRDNNETNRKRYGGVSCPDPEFTTLPLDTPGSLRNRLTELVNAGDKEVSRVLAEAGIESERGGKMSFRRGDGSTVVIDLVQRGAEWFAHVPDERSGEWRTITTNSKEALMSVVMKFLNRGPAIRPLRRQEEIAIRHLCVAGRLAEAAERYAQARCGQHISSEVIDDPAYQQMFAECVWFIFIHSTPQYSDTREARAFITRHVGSRSPSLPLLREAYRQYLQSGSAEPNERNETPEQRGPSPDDLEKLSDQAVQELLHGVISKTARAHAAISNRLRGE
jgi:hypothetical protein